MKHLTTEQLSRRLDGELAGRPLEEVDGHLAQCGDCRAALAELSAADRGLKRVLDHDPGEAYFESFAARVEDRIRAAGLSGAQARRDSWLGWLRSPRRLAWAGAVAAVAGAAAIALLNSDRTPALRDNRLEQRVTQEAPAPSADREQNAAPAPSVLRSAAPAPGSAVPPAENERLLAKAAPERDEVAAKDEKKESVAQSARAREVRRDASGELVPLPERRFAAPPPAAEPARPAVDGGVRVRKRASALPLAGVEEGRASAEPQRLTPSMNQVSDKLSSTTSADIQLCGQVVDPSGRPVAGAQVVLPQAGRTASSDSSGRFCLWAPPGDHELAVMAVGFDASRQQVHVGGEMAEARITVKPVPVLGQSSLLSIRGGRPGEEPVVVGGMPVEHGDGLRGVVEVMQFPPVPARARSAVADAERLTNEVAKSGYAATSYDKAASAWEKALARVPEGPARLACLEQLAVARYRAWVMGATPERARAASKALSRYVSLAPAGRARDEAASWLEQVKK